MIVSDILVHYVEKSDIIPEITVIHFKQLIVMKMAQREFLTFTHIVNHYLERYNLWCLR